MLLKRDPVDRDHVDDRAKRLGWILKWIRQTINGHIFLSRGLLFESKLPGFPTKYVTSKFGMNTVNFCFIKTGLRRDFTRSCYGCKFAHPYLNVTKRKNFTFTFFTFNIIKLDIFCENLAYVAPPIQVL